MHTPLRILIVEDVETTVMAIQESLEQAGHIVCGAAASYVDAIALMKRESPDVALVDIALNGKPDGIETARELVKIKPIPILYLTANTEDETYKRAKQTNPVAFLHKPLRVREIAMQVDLALHNYYEGKKVELVSTPEHLYLPDSSGRFRVNAESVIFMLADGAYVKVFVKGNELARLKEAADPKLVNPLSVSMSLGNLLDYMPDHFHRLSRSTAINLNYLNRIEASQVLMEEYASPLPMPEGGQQILLKRLNAVRPRHRR